MARLTSSSDFQRELFRQRDAAVALFGQDSEASAIARAVRPYTPPEYAELVYHDWGQTFHALVAREADSERSLGGISSEVIRRAREEKRTFTEQEASLIHADSGMPLSLAMSRALNKAFAASRGSTRVNEFDVTCLSGQTCHVFWDELDTYGINAGAVRASVTSGERWSTLVGALQDNAERAAEFIGEAAAKTLRETGRALGSGVGGFFGELGVVDSAILIGAGYLAFRIL
jgi:hypothetical protein